MAKDDVTAKILIIEDDQEISQTLQKVLSAVGYTIFAANNGEDGKKLIVSEEPDLILTDMMMPRMGGFPVLEFLQELDAPPKVIMMTANEGGRHKAYAEMLGVCDYLRKPFAMDIMLNAVSQALAASKEDASSKPAPKKKRATKKKS